MAVLFDRWLFVVPEKEGLLQQEVLWSLLKSWQWAFQQCLVVVLAVVAEPADVVVLERFDVVAMHQKVQVVLEA
ncbi:hypothetical protein F2Q69_00013337 [Brassica cretica]|uniref:Uncharacterized protein n=1 Tax=Brassica cretica TaxID=69181 RepID=A0A8S9QME1_BRACR|nr:hypothetical protein F2Q69_00013337 [Brassica cretica]